MMATKAAGLRCGICAAFWDDPRARFCGRCGQPLDERATTEATDSTPVTPPSERMPPLRGLIAMVFGGVMLLIGVALIASGDLPDVGAGPEVDGMSVDLPNPREVSGSGGGSTAATAHTDASDPVTCRPEGCELWRADVGDGNVLEIDGVLVHAGASVLSAISVDDGSLLWSAPLPDAPRAQLLPVDGDPLVLVTGAADEVEARSPADGHVRWRASLPGQADEAVRHGESLLISGGPEPGFIANLDASTGEPRWVHTDLTVLGIDAGSPLVKYPGDVIAALDPASGEAIWRRALSPVGTGPSQFAQGGGRLVFADGGGLTIIDGETGEVERQAAIGVAPTGWIQMTDSVLIIASPVGEIEAAAPLSLDQSRPGTMLVLNLIDPEAEIGVFEGVVDLLWLDGASPLTRGRQPDTEGFVLGALDPEALVLHRLSPAGEPIWRRHVVREPGYGELDAACCWSLEPGMGAAALLAVPPRGSSDPVRAIAADGRIVSRFDSPSPLERADRPRWPGRNTATLPGSSIDGSTIVAGSRASAEVPGSAATVASDPVVLATRTGLVAIDPGFLAGER